MAQLFAPNERDARRIGKVVKRVEKMIEDSSKSARIGGATSDDVYLVKLTLAVGAASEMKWEGHEVTFNKVSSSYDALAEGIQWGDPTNTALNNNAGYIIGSREIGELEEDPTGFVFEARLIYDTDGDPAWVFMVDNQKKCTTVTVVTDVQLDGSNNLQIKTTEICAIDLQTESAWITVTGWTKAPCP
jgi:hypothetical protein